ncbi:MAG: hypothetical protein V3T77_05165, partial [Planctomycetota bacterium]
ESSYGLSPGLVGKAGEPERGSQVSLGFLRELARRIYDEVGRLAHRAGPEEEEPPERDGAGMAQHRSTWLVDLRRSLARFWVLELEGAPSSLAN